MDVRTLKSGEYRLLKPFEVKQLKKYLDVAGKFLSEETKEIVNWLIVNNDSYISDLSNDEDENALAGFYKAGVPKDEHLKELYKLIGTIVKSGRTLEIPVFQTKSQFESILNNRFCFYAYRSNRTYNSQRSDRRSS